MNRFRLLIVVAVVVLVGVAVYVFRVRAGSCEDVYYRCKRGCETAPDPETCRRACGTALRECNGFVQTVEKPIRIDCPEGPHGSAPCLKNLSELCATVGATCVDCARTLCGDSRWSFEADSSIVVTLLANDRTLATSTGGGNSATLAIPKDIKLHEEEQLRLRLETKSQHVAMRRGE